MSKRKKENLWRIIASTVLFLFVVLLPLEKNWKGVLYLIPYFIVGYDVLFGAVRNIIHGHIFDEKFLMAIATVGAFIIGEYPEAVFVMLFFQIGELFQNIAVGKSRKSISKLMDIAPETANVLKDGEFCEAFPEEVEKGDVLLIKLGEKIPVDGVVIEGESDIDTSNMTGESLPRFVKVGDSVISGCVNLSGPIKIRAEKEYENSTVAKILELVEHSAMNKGKYENFITRFAKIYTPLVVILALLLAFIPPIFMGDVSSWVFRALSFLVVSCPCALVISVPLSFFGGIGAASRYGILIKGSNYLELLEKCTVVVTDKTGTLTEGKLFVEEFEGDKDTLKYAKSLEMLSSHPIARAVCESCEEHFTAQNVSEFPGKGMTGVIANKEVVVGNALFLEEKGINLPHSDKTIYVAVCGAYAGSITIGDKIKENAKESLAELKKMGVKRVVLLTGDNEHGARKIEKLKLANEIYHSLLPDEKVLKLEEIMKDKNVTMYIGDGVNDAPVLKRADIGVAMGNIGSDAAIEASDIVLMNDNLGNIKKGMEISRKTMRIARENIIFSILVKVGVLILCALGFADMWQAVFADVGVMVIAVLNTMRTLKM